MAIASSAPRFLLSAPIAALVTLALGLVMQALIAQRPIGHPPHEPAPTIDVVSSLVDTPPAIRPPPAPPAVITPPEPVQIRPKPSGPVEDGPGVTYEYPGVERGPPETGPLWLERAPRRIFTAVPIFPQNVRVDAGSCLVGFDVLRDGSTANIAVISCTNAGFTRASMNAVRDTRYETGYGEDGPVVTTGMSLEIVFRIER
jgi:hypothetical protein